MPSLELDKSSYTYNLHNLMRFLTDQWQFGFLKPFTIWFFWLLLGTLYYGIRDNFGIAKGFYFAGELVKFVFTVFFFKYYYVFYHQLS
jgi:hypothetical protein